MLILFDTIKGGTVTLFFVKNVGVVRQKFSPNEGALPFFECIEVGLRYFYYLFIMYIFYFYNHYF